jgi:predicted aspartyl protease
MCGASWYLYRTQARHARNRFSTDANPDVDAPRSMVTSAHEPEIGESFVSTRRTSFVVLIGATSVALCMAPARRAGLHRRAPCVHSLWFRARCFRLIVGAVPY